MTDMRVPEEWRTRHLRAMGAAIRELRDRRGLSQEELGFAGKFHRNYVGLVERGQINPTFRILLQFCRALDVRLPELAYVYERQLAAGSWQTRPPRRR
jgi:transcriptional regulator with XRE-family HTH domain